MIKFFRNIRKKLLAEGKTANYLKYAIGEIVLVVIGILIALQINNWNEARKDRIYEVKMLNEVAKTLNLDLISFKYQKERLEKLDSAVNVFIKLVYDKAIFNDTIFNKGISRWYFLRTGTFFLYNRGPYEAIKSSGIDKISNDSLRNSLINFYDFLSPRYKEFATWTDRDYDNDVKKLASFLQDPFIEVVDEKEEIYSKFPEDLFQNPEFLKLLLNMRERAKINNGVYQRYIKNIESLIEQINKEIK